MNSRQTRQFEMLVRVRDFGNTHRHLFADPSVASSAFAAVGVIITELAAADISKQSASASARADRKLAARKTLTDLLMKVSHTARVVRTRNTTLPAFQIRHARTDQALLTTARQIARDANAFETDFNAHGIATKAIAEAANAFETAMHDRGMSRADQFAARTRIEALLASALEHLRTLDVIVGNELAGDDVIQATWRRARRVEDARRPRGSGVEKPAPVAAVPTAGPAVPTEAPAPLPTPVPGPGQ